MKFPKHPITPASLWFAPLFCATLSMPVITSLMRFSLSSPSLYSPPLLYSRATASGHLFCPLLPFGVAVLRGWVESSGSLGPPLSPLSSSLLLVNCLYTTASRLWLPHSFLSMRSFHGCAFIFSFLLRFSFLPSSLALSASHPWLSVEVLFISFLS